MANDKDEQVSDTIQDSLHSIGLNQPDLVLSACNDFLAKNPKVSDPLTFKAPESHRITLLETIRRVLDERKETIDEELGNAIVLQAFKELTGDRVPATLTNRM